MIKKDIQNSNAHSPQGIVHLAVDVQRVHTNFLPETRRHAFTAGVSTFAIELRKLSVPTVWIAFGAWHGVPWLVHPQDLRPEVFKKRCEIFGLDNLSMGENDPLYVKNAVSSFGRDNLLLSYLHKLNTKTVIVSGINTSACVASCVSGAINNGLGCVVAYDKLAEATKKAIDLWGGDEHPFAHKQLIRDAVSQDFHCHKGRVITDILEKNPNYFHRPAPRWRRHVALAA